MATDTTKTFPPGSFDPVTGATTAIGIAAGAPQMLGGSVAPSAPTVFPEGSFDPVTGATTAAGTAAGAPMKLAGDIIPTAVPIPTLPTPTPDLTITPVGLTPPTPPTLPITTSTITGADGLVAGATQYDAQVAAAQADEATTQASKDVISSELSALLGTLVGEGAATIAAEKAAGVPGMQAELATVTGQIKIGLAEYNQMKSNFDAITLENRNKPITMASITGNEAAINFARMQTLNRKASDIGLLQANAQALSGQLDAAQATANRAVDLKYQDKRDNINVRIQQLALVQDTLSAKEKITADLLDKQYKEQQNAIEIQIANDKGIQAIALKLAELGVDPSIIKNAKTEAEAIQLAGVNLRDPIKELQERKLRQELDAVRAVVKDVGELVKIGGQDYIRYKDGTISLPILPEAADKITTVERIKDKIIMVDDLAKPGVAMNVSTGALRGAPIPFLFKNRIMDWRAGMVNLISKLTVDELGRVKSDGVTFGALSNGERQAVGDAATILSAGQVYTGEGDDRVGTGKFKLSEKKVREALDVINKYYKIDFERRAGMSYETYQNNPGLLGKQELQKSEVILQTAFDNPQYTLSIKNAIAQFPNYNASEILQILGI